MGLRERSQAKKRAAIQQAALKLFEAKGFEKASMKEIAASAGVGFGTVFLYFENKRALLFSLFEDEADRVSVTPFQSVDFGGDDTDVLSNLFWPIYDVFEERIDLARDYIRESTFASADEEGGSIIFSRPMFINNIKDVLRALCAKGRIRKDLDVDAAAEMIYATFSGAVRQWLRQDIPKAVEGRRILGSMFSIIVTGLQPRLNIS